MYNLYLGLSFNENLNNTIFKTIKLHLIPQPYLIVFDKKKVIGWTLPSRSMFVTVHSTYRENVTNFNETYTVIYIKEAHW